MRDKLKGKRIMVWIFMGNARMYEALRDYGDRIDTIGLFSFKVDKTGTITESGVAISNMLTYINKWPHIRWLLTVANDGANSIFKALRDNTDGAQDKYCSELVRIMEKYPWCSGVDIDLEKGDDYSTREASTAMFAHIYITVKAYDPTKEMNICLPGMTSVNGSVGGENWCVYGDLDKYCDIQYFLSPLPQRTLPVVFSLKKRRAYMPAFSMVIFSFHFLTIVSMNSNFLCVSLR